jgi:hypothetical protein
MNKDVIAKLREIMGDSQWTQEQLDQWQIRPKKKRN